MRALKEFAVVLWLGVCPDVWAHPGHPALSLEHTHSGQDFNAVLLIVLALGVLLALGYGYRCQSRP